MISNSFKDTYNFILYEHVNLNVILIELDQILKSEESKKLNQQSLYYYLKNVILKNNIVIKNLLHNNKIFKIIYDSHIINKKKTFELFEDIINSMALSWLMFLYH